MKISTTDRLTDGEKINEVLGIARGSTVRSKNIIRDVLAMAKSIVGGEVKDYTKLQSESREQAIERMKKDAEIMGADAGVCVRFMTSTITAGTSEIVAYGTAVKIGN